MIGETGNEGYSVPLFIGSFGKILRVPLRILFLSSSDFTDVAAEGTHIITMAKGLRQIMLSSAMLLSLSRGFVFLPRHGKCMAVSRSFDLSILRSSRNIIDNTRHGVEIASFSTISKSEWIPSELVGVIFDMDGTLLKPVIDFADMRRRIYQIATNDLGRVVTEGCVLEITNQLSPEGQALAHAAFVDIEQKAIEMMQFEEGLLELCQWLDEQNIRRAVLTRNVRNSVEAMHTRLREQHGISSFSPAVARDSLCAKGNLLPPKPHPDAIHHICEQWQCQVFQVIMVGDSVADDIVAATRAGCGASVLLSKLDHDNNSGNDKDSKLEEQIPTLTVKSLRDLHQLLQGSLEEA